MSAQVSDHGGEAQDQVVAWRCLWSLTKDSIHSVVGIMLGNLTISMKNNSNLNFKYPIYRHILKTAFLHQEQMSEKEM